MNDLANACFPVWLKLSNVPVLVVGGGNIALRRSKKLAACGAQLTVVSPTFLPRFSELRKDGTLRLVTRPFETRDLEGQRMVFAATDNPDSNESVCRQAEERGLWASSATLLECATLFPAASLNRGDLSVAISSGGRAPLLSMELRNLLGDLLAEDWSEVLDTLALTRMGILETERESGETPNWEPLKRQIREHFNQAARDYLI